MTMVRAMSACVAAACLAIGLGAATSAHAQAKPESVTFKTGSTGGSWYPIGAGLARILGQDGVKANIEQGGGNANLVSIARGDGDIGFGYTVTLPDAAAGVAPFAEKITNLRGIAILYTNVLQTIVSADSGVNTFADLKGKSFASQTQGNAATTIFDQMLHAYGLNGHDDLDVVVRGGPGHGANALKDRRAVGFQSVTTVPNAAMAEVAASLPIKVLPVSDEAFAKMKEINAGYVRATVPAGTYAGVDTDVLTLGTDTILFANEAFSDDAAYWIARILAERIDEVRAIHNAMESLTGEQMASIAGVEIHPGAARYYREAGLLK